MLAARIQVETNFTPDPDLITGLNCRLEYVYEDVLPNMVSIANYNDEHGRVISISPTSPSGFPPGSILLFETEMLSDARHCYHQLCRKLCLSVHGSWYIDCTVRTLIPELYSSLAALSPIKMNIILYRVENEEQDSIPDSGLYEIPGFGRLVYAGLQGWVGVIREVVRTNSLGHPLCAHLRQGVCALDFVTGRLEK